MRGLGLGARALLLASALFGPAVMATVPSPAPESLPRVPPFLRVGLATDQEVVELACCELVAGLPDGPVRMDRGLAVRPAPGASVPPVYRLQVAALKDEIQARELASTLGREVNQPADAVFDAGTDLYRVRVGAWRTRDEARSALGQLEVAGVEESWVVSEAGRLEQPALSVEAAGRRWSVPGRWLAVTSRSAGGLAWRGSRLRGSLLVFLNDRGTLNVVNALPLEAYLRGVVPMELGPEEYPSLEALKAQTVAARTYTLRNLGEFVEEGYDICATPRCQVYGGVAVEHPLSDQAIVETAGEVLAWGGELVDALYSANCGGHTEDVRYVFPRKDEPYLEGVPCLEAGTTRLSSAASPGVLFPADALVSLVGPMGPSGVESLGRRVRALVESLGLPAPDDRPSSLEPEEVRRFLASVLDLAVDLRLLTGDAALRRLLDSPSAEWTGTEEALARLFLSTGVAGPGSEPLDGVALEALVYGLGRHIGRVEEVAGQLLGLTDGGLLFRDAAGARRSLAIGAGVAAYGTERGGARSGPVDLGPGDPVRLLVRGDEVLALVRELRVPEPGRGAPPRRGPWRRFRSDAELASLVSKRYPGLELRGLEVLDRGVSGRVAKLRLEGAGGRSAEVEGLAVRWTLDLPDTWFDFSRVDEGSRRGWSFRGRGWGHGVGMCQIGAVGMGLRGLDYRQILAHYYGGAPVVELRQTTRSAGDPLTSP